MYAVNGLPGYAAAGVGGGAGHSPELGPEPPAPTAAAEPLLLLAGGSGSARNGKPPKGPWWKGRWKPPRPKGRCRNRCGRCIRCISGKNGWKKSFAVPPSGGATISACGAVTAGAGRLAITRSGMEMTEFEPGPRNRMETRKKKFAVSRGSVTKRY